MSVARKPVTWIRAVCRADRETETDAACVSSQSDPEGASSLQPPASSVYGPPAGPVKTEMTVSTPAPQVESSYVAAATGVNSSHSEEATPWPAGAHDTGTPGSLASDPALSLLTSTVWGNGPAPGTTSGVAQPSELSGIVTVTETEARAPRLSRAERLTG